jgi:hypothetical protein
LDVQKTYGRNTSFPEGREKPKKGNALHPIAFVSRGIAEIPCPALIERFKVFTLSVGANGT